VFWQSIITSVESARPAGVDGIPLRFRKVVVSGILIPLDCTRFRVSVAIQDVSSPDPRSRSRVVVMSASPRPPRLYYMPRTRSSRVLWVLEEIGEPYERTEITRDQRRSPEHLRRNPLGRVPVLELGDGTTMFESAAICLQLADLYPAAGLAAPLGSSERARIYQWVLFAVAELEGPLFRWIRALSGGTEPTSESLARDRFTEAAAALESAVSGGDWLLGAQFTVDVMCVSVLQGADSREMLGPWPGLEAYVRRAEARPAHARAAAISARPRS
jgi:glutathione S-transferase